MGMAGSRKLGCLYREVGLSPQVEMVCEHAIPVTAMVSLYEAGTPFEELVFFPVARISRKSDRVLTEMGLSVSGHDLVRPFMRYHEAKIEIETHFGKRISCNEWTIEDHWRLVDETPEISRIRQEVLSKLSERLGAE